MRGNKVGLKWISRFLNFGLVGLLLGVLNVSSSVLLFDDNMEVVCGV